MKTPKKDPMWEDRIHNEAIADANGPEEQAMGWYYYLDDKIRFPFQAKCITARAISPLLKGETVEVQGMAPEDACSNDMLVLIPWQGRTMGCHYPNWPGSTWTSPPPKPSPTGITGSPKATASEPRPGSRSDLRTPTETSPTSANTSALHGKRELWRADSATPCYDRDNLLMA